MTLSAREANLEVALKLMYDEFKTRTNCCGGRTLERAIAVERARLVLHLGVARCDER